MENKGSLPHLQGPTTCPYPQPDKSKVDELCILYTPEVWHIWCGEGGDNGESKTIFKLQKEVIRLISNVSRVPSCRKLFRTSNLFPVLFTVSLNVMGDSPAIHLYIW